jgi:hypothetical protein
VPIENKPGVSRPAYLYFCSAERAFAGQFDFFQKTL